MDISDQKSRFQSNGCCVCLTDDEISNLNKNKILYNAFKQLFKPQVQQDIQRYICTKCLLQLEVISRFIYFINNRWIVQQEHVFDHSFCKICFTPENLVIFPEYLLNVFQNITNYQVQSNCSHPQNICNECLNKLENISTFIDTVRNNDEPLQCMMTIKEEPLENKESACLDNNFKKGNVFETSVKTENENNLLENEIKDEPDDEFIETSTKNAVKSEPKNLSFEFETNNNFIIKSDKVSNGLHDPKDLYRQDGDDQKNELKLEIDEEGLQFNYNELIPINCSACNRSFTTTRGLLNHLKQRIRCRFQAPLIAHSYKAFLKKIAEPFKCQVCLKYFSSVKKKIEHTKAHFGKTCVICLFCGKPFIKCKEYLQHCRHHHTKQLPIKCKMCHRKFPTKIIYYKHLSKHKKKTKKYMCNICCQPYSKKSLFKIHVKKPKLSCPYCPKIYCHMGQLASHLRMHTGERPYQCADCSLRFAHKGNLIKHSRIHTGYKPHMCTICLRGFSRPDYLTKHYLSIHQKVVKGTRKTYKKKLISIKLKERLHATFDCHICSKGFLSKSALSSHSRVHNKGKIFQCTVCDKSFSYKGLLTGHMKIHLDYRPFECNLCPKRFIKRNDLTRHTYTHTKEKNFRCEICYEKFSRKDVLRYHLRGHTGQRPYECEYCYKTFVQKSNLTNHLKRCRSVLEIDVVN